MSVASEESSESTTAPQFAHAVRGYDRVQVDEYIERVSQWAAETHARAVEAERLASGWAQEVQALQARVRELEAERPTLPEEAVRSAAERAAETLALAGRDAESIRRRASEEADRQLSEAGRQALEIVEAARSSLSDLVEQGRRERDARHERADNIVAEAEARAAEVLGRASSDAERIVAEAKDKAEQILAEAAQASSQVREQTETARREAEDAIRRLQVERTQIVGDLGRLRGAIQSLIDTSEPELDVTRVLSGPLMSELQAGEAAGDPTDPTEVLEAE
jgi:cell division septum initiation protein DivIVA